MEMNGTTVIACPVDVVWDYVIDPAPRGRPYPVHTSR